MPIGFHTDTDDLMYDLDLQPMGGLHGEDEEDYDERN